MSADNQKMSDTVLREAQLVDIAELHRIRMSVNENALSNPDLVTPKDYEDFLISRGKGWLCEIESSIVGFSIVDMVDHNVWALFVHPLHEQKGIGSKLHDVMIDWYFDQINDTIWLSTSPGTRAESFYHKAGWRQTGFQTNGEVRFEMGIDDWRKSRG